MGRSNIERRVLQLTSLVLGWVRFPFAASKYKVKRGYRHRHQYVHFSAKGAKDEGQKEVYEYAKQVAQENGYTKVVDVGCGSGYKLIHNFAADFEFIGLDILDTYENLLEKYPQYQWANSLKVNYAELEGDLVICSDVIEHVLDPVELLNKIKTIQGAKRLVISTPDRLLARGWFDFGPPMNPTHVREWNGKEFATFMQAQGFKVLSHQISNYAQHTQLMLCEIQDNG